MVLGFFQKFRDKVLLAVGDAGSTQPESETNNLIALGALLWAVADADKQFLPSEHDKIKKILKEYCHITPEDMPIVLRSIEEASFERIDIYAFAKEAGEGLDRKGKIEIIDNLFRVALIDHELDAQEEAIIRQAAGHFGLDHSEFIEAKEKIKKEFQTDSLE